MGVSDTTEKDWEEHYKESMKHFDDTIIVHTTGLEEGIRCAMCTNPIANDRGCDGGCRVNEYMYKKVLDAIRVNTIK